MNKKTHSLFIVLLFSFLIVSVFAQVSVGLKEGDWVEYTAIYTGDAPETYANSARIEVQAVQGTLITVEIITKLQNGIESSITDTFDLESGAPDLIVIPANLSAGAEIHHEHYGTFTLEGVEDYSLKGETRELVYANVMQTEFSWDRVTGIMIESVETKETLTQTFRAVDTNMFQTQALDIEPTVLYGIIIAIVIILVVVIILVSRRKNRSKFSPL
jgi:hypothetical protein